jgi:serpin B
MKKVLLFILLFATLIAVPACTQTSLGAEIKSDKPRDTAPVVSAADLTELVDGNNTFAFDLFNVLRQESGNLFYSPYSISEALSMTWAGAGNGTETDMARALRFTLPQGRLHPAFNSLDLQLKQRGEGAKGTNEEGFKLNIANAIWGQQGFKFQPAFLDVLAQSYGAGLRTVDYVNQTEKSRTTINDWVSGQTSGKIKDLIPQGSIDTYTRLVLTNAIYFNAAWRNPFDKDLTSSGTFHTSGSGDVTVPMMHQTENNKYTEGNGYQAVELPYDGNQLSMVILLPEAGQYDVFEKALTADAVNKILANMQNTSVVLTLPQFEYDATLGLKDALSQLGMAAAFTENADFSGMDGKKDLFIQDVLHKAYVSVNEAGTEAAAASAVIVGVTSAPVNQSHFTADRPFIFFIRDIATGQIIFIGRVLNPV